MRMAFVTPIDRRSAIARVSLDLLSHLDQRVDVTVFAEPTDRPMRCPFPTRPIRGLEVGQLDGFDRVVTVIGDSEFHRHAFAIACRRPTLVILHDVVVAHLVVAAYGQGGAIEEIRRWHGGDRADSAAASLMTAVPVWLRDEIVQTPLFEPVLEHAEGVITHSEFAAAQIRPRTMAPVRVLPLPCTPLASGEAVPQQRMRLLTVGHANTNKCHELVIEALSALGRNDVEYVIAGSIEPRRRRHLEGLAVSLGVAPSVRILGAVSDDELLDLLANTTISVNLRQPPMEGASASVLEQMAAGTPTIVFDHGFYAELPDHAVCKVPTALSPSQLAAHIGALLDDPERRRSIAAAAQSYVSATHRADTYATGMLDFLDEVDAYRPYGRMAETLAAGMRRCATPIGSPLATRWSAAVSAMLTPLPTVRSD